MKIILALVDFKIYFDSNYKVTEMKYTIQNM